MTFSPCMGSDLRDMGNAEIWSRKRATNRAQRTHYEPITNPLPTHREPIWTAIASRQGGFGWTKPLFGASRTNPLHTRAPVRALPERTEKISREVAKRQPVLESPSAKIHMNSSLFNYPSAGWRNPPNTASHLRVKPYPAFAFFSCRP